jgi:ADP-L-glycero-D-manno-heptose 6-epimerase
MILLDWCLDQDVQFLYASSAATYGGSRVFKEERQYEGPLNVYRLLQVPVRPDRAPALGTEPVVANRRLPLFQRLRTARIAQGIDGIGCFPSLQPVPRRGKVKLFEGCEVTCNGVAERDFVFVGDVAKVNLYFLDHPEKSGIFNLGTGRAQSFNELAVANGQQCRELAGEMPKESLEELLRAQGSSSMSPSPKR